MHSETGDLRLCMEMANATTRMLIHWEPVVMDDLGSPDAYPSIYNYAFSCELYLKAIMMQRSPTNEFFCSHDLKNLFEYLDEKDQDAIREEYERNAIDEDGKRKLWERPFDQTLEEMRKVFIDWRYAFSKDGLRINVSRLISLARAIRSNACCITGIHYDLPQLTSK